MRSRISVYLLLTILLIQHIKCAAGSYGYIIRGDDEFKDQIRHFLIDSDQFSMYSFRELNGDMIGIFSTNHNIFGLPLSDWRDMVLNSLTCTYYVSYGVFSPVFEIGITPNHNTFRFAANLANPLERNALFIQVAKGYETTVKSVVSD